MITIKIMFLYLLLLLLPVEGFIVPQQPAAQQTHRRHVYRQQEEHHQVSSTTSTRSQQLTADRRRRSTQPASSSSAASQQSLRRNKLLVLLYLSSSSSSSSSSPSSDHHRGINDNKNHKKNDGDDDNNDDDDANIQWYLFQKYQTPILASFTPDEDGPPSLATTTSSPSSSSSTSSWNGVWTTYDYMGDVLDETIASVDYMIQQQEEDKHEQDKEDTNNNINNNNKNRKINQQHRIVLGATKRSDCTTCFDVMETRTIPVATYTYDNLISIRKVRSLACSMIQGPIVLRSGIMAIELVLCYSNQYRLRVRFQYAPVWDKGNMNSSDDTVSSTTTNSMNGPPNALKLFRTIVSRETLQQEPTTSSSTSFEEDTVLYRTVSPFGWHKQWGGLSYTWGPNTGYRKWFIEQLPDNDQWHGISPVEVWNLRLISGGICIQTPRIIISNEIGICRLAWLPNDDTLLRMEVGISALQPTTTSINNNDDNDSSNDNIVRLEPPTLVSLRCDILDKQGDYDGEPAFLQKGQSSSSLLP